MKQVYGVEGWTDEELLRRMIAREPRAWREFHARFDRLVFRCIQKVTARFARSLGSDDGREIYAQFLFSLTTRDMHKLRSFAPERGNKLSSWIGMLASNAAWDHLRTVARTPTVGAMFEAEVLPSSEKDPYEEALDRERWTIVYDALQTFSEKDQTFVRLYYMDGLSPEEVAREMSISVKTVYSKKHKIRSRLEQALSPSMSEAA